MFHFFTVPFALISLNLDSDTIRAVVVAQIGENAPRTPFLIGEVGGLALDDSNHLFVADFQDPRVLVFSFRGEHLATIGRKGRGPGEFTAPTGPVVAADGALYVRNNETLMRFVKDPLTGLPTVFDRVFEGPSMASWRSKLASVIDRVGRFHFPVEAGVPDRRPGAEPGSRLTVFAYWRYTLDGRRLDSVAVPVYPTARSTWASYGGRMVFGLNVVPFHPNPTWAVSSSGTLLSGPADRYEVLETDSLGRPLRRIVRTIPSKEIPAAERAESLSALRRRIDSLPVPVTQVRGASKEVRAQSLPNTYPAYLGLLVTPTGEIWVRRWSPPPLRNTTIFDILDVKGQYRTTVVLPVSCALEPAPAVRGNTVACVQIDPVSGAEIIIVTRL